MVRFPKAKINIGLSVTDRRNDGYHNIQSIFYPIDLNDVLEAIPNKTESFNLHLSGLPIKGAKEDNLIYKAWGLLREAHQISGVDAALMKIIPMGAGLGGGSSDGAHMLLLLNALFDLKLSTQQLQLYAAELGSDCPFFINEKPAFVSGRGETLSDIKLNLSGKYIALIYPKTHIGTAEAYGLITPKQPNFDLKKISINALSSWENEVINDFEAPILERYSEIAQAKNSLISAGAVYASMTGSGSTVYGIFSKPPELKVQQDWFVWSGKL